MLEAQRRLKPTSQVINANLASVYLESKQPQRAIPILEDMAFLDKQNPLPYQLLTEAYKQTGNKALEHFSNAESMALRADYKGAIDQLNFAYKAADGQPLQIARIEAKIRQFRVADRALDELKK